MENARGQIVASSGGLAGAAPNPAYNQPDLKLLIVGRGRVGSQIAANMDRAGHDVVIVDRDPNAFSRAARRGVLTREVKGGQVAGNGADVDVLRRAGVEPADAFAAVTRADHRSH